MKTQLVAALLFGGMVMMMSNRSNAQQAEKVSSEFLMQTSTSWDGVSYNSYPQGVPELSILKITVPAHTTFGWHTHPIPNAAYVLSGHLTVEKQSDGSKKKIYAGETLAETVGTIHRGFTENEPVTLIVFYAGAKNLPLSNPVK
ncbi:cupin domain-containing protein [Enterobacter sp. A103]|uniref:cupin domain-containing protein n=1 Tax=Enterobacter sp. A103 TaxID=3102785 RepID=UPI002ACAE3C0|nr:cupin domain-containing protein [Enterobacter sp. A103]MDZ5641633.1 cupin domain-containing protein [Enterobacter sp. A103]